MKRFFLIPFLFLLSVGVVHSQPKDVPPKLDPAPKVDAVQQQLDAIKAQQAETNKLIADWFKAKAADDRLKIIKEQQAHATGLVVPHDVKDRHAKSWAKHGHWLKALPWAPASFDCRTVGWMPDFDDQGNCGSCHMFSGADTCASAFIKAGYGSKLTISKQQILDCNYRDACGGGWPEDTVKIIRDKGGVTDADYGVTYHASPGTCKKLDPSKYIKIADYGFCSQADGVADWEDFKSCMVAKGVISICYDASGTPSSGENGPVWKGTGGRNVNHAIKSVAYKEEGGQKLVLCWNQWNAGGADLFWAVWGANELGTSALWASATPLPPSPLAPVINSPLTATAQVGTPFSYTIAATNAPTSFTASGLPAGLTLNGPTISGTLTTVGTATITLGATNASGAGTATMTLTIGTTPPIPPTPIGGDTFTYDWVNKVVTLPSGWTAASVSPDGEAMLVQFLTELMDHPTTVALTATDPTLTANRSKVIEECKKCKANPGSLKFNFAAVFAASMKLFSDIATRNIAALPGDFAALLAAFAAKDEKPLPITPLRMPLGPQGSLQGKRSEEIAREWRQQVWGARY